MTSLLQSVFCALAFLAFSNAKYLSAGPQSFDESSSSSMPQKLDKRFDSQVFTLYLTPSEMKALTGYENMQIKEEKKIEQSKSQNNNEKQMEAQVDEIKAELRGLIAHNSFYPKEESTSENKNWNYGLDFAKWYSEQQQKEEQKQNTNTNSDSGSETYLIKNEQQGNGNLYQKEENTQQKSSFEKESDWIPFNLESAIKDSAKSFERHRQQWNNIFQNNAQLKTSMTPKENQQIKESNVENNAAEKIQSNTKNAEKSEIEKQIEAIFRQQQAFENAKETNTAQGENNNQRPPIIIHKEVRIVKHHPVSVLKKVQVPTPVLVPVPEPYEVKIPHAYPVPYEVIRHIPVPVVRHH